MAAPKYRDVIITNKHQKKGCIIRVASQRSNITSHTYAQLQESLHSESNSKKTTDSASVGVGYGGVSVNVSASHSEENQSAFSDQKKQATMNDVKVTYSKFIEVGFIEIRPGKSKKFAVQGVLCYITVANSKANINNWPTRGSQFVFTNDEDLDEVEIEEKIEKKIEKKVEPTARYKGSAFIHWDKNRFFEGGYKISGYECDFLAHDGDKRKTMKSKVYKLGVPASVGDSCIAYWNKGKKWANPGTVTAERHNGRELHVRFDDGDKGWLVAQWVHAKVNI
eukprot:337526_1